MDSNPRNPALVTDSPTPARQPRSRGQWLFEAALVLVLLIALYLRVTGLKWDGDQHLHPDERFLTMVASAIHSVGSVGEYFDTAHSSLNPATNGFDFYVYGTFPLFLTRYVAEALHMTGYNQVHLVGRVLSALADLLLVFLVYLIGLRLYNRRVGLLAATFSAFAVHQIQQSHYFTVDNFANMFTALALYIAIVLATQPADRPMSKDWKLHLAFGLAFGAGLASKLSATPAALLLPAAALLRFARLPREEQARQAGTLILHLTLGGLTALFTFRVLQPYAFAGPGFFSKLSAQWIQNIRTLKNMTTSKADIPPAMQWVRRPIWFGAANITLWGAGLGLALSGWVGLLWLGWRLWKRQEAPVLGMVWGWGMLYLLWQSALWNPTMRYFLPVYPILALAAAWLWIYLPDHTRGWPRRLAIAGSTLALLAAAVWAFAFVSIYHHTHTRIAATRWLFDEVPAAVDIGLQTDQGERWQHLGLPAMRVLSPEGKIDKDTAIHTLNPRSPLEMIFRARASGPLSAIRLYRVVAANHDTTPVHLTLTLRHANDPQPMAETQITLTPAAQTQAPPQQVRATFPTPLTLTKNETYTLTITTDHGRLWLLGAAVANESSWDDSLPLRMDGYDPFGGLYQGLNFEMYFDANQQKVQRFLRILDQADYIFISSSRQWGSLPRFWERYPLTDVYYRHLLGCPAWETVEHCYDVARVGTYHGDLGYDLIGVFESDPTLGPLRINDQPSEEAFTVYDHPKVFIFRKNRETYSHDHAAALFDTVDLDTVIHILPGEALPHPANLLLPPARWGLQQVRGTFERLFAAGNPLNRWPGLGLLVWYGFIALLGWLVWPLLRPFFAAFPDRGYPAARLAGMLLFAFLAWLYGSTGLPLSRGALLGVLVLLALVAAWAARRQWPDLKEDLRHRKREILWAEALFLGFFLLDLYIRWQNPDLWHPWRGGEKPMDLSFFTAVLRSATFPPYDPWFAHGYINYYYWGFVLVGMPVKLLGLKPTLAYNLVLPTLFAGVALSGYAVARGLYHALEPRRLRPRLVGLAGAMGLVLLGNLGTVKMLWQGLQKLAAPGGEIAHGSLLQHVLWAGGGFIALLSGAHLPYSVGDWYWLPSRAIPAPGEVEPITEFPFFTFLYADLHAHMMALGLTLLALLWAIGLALWVHRHQVSLGWWAGALAWGGLIIGALRPTNTWDVPTYLGLGMLAAAYAAWENTPQADWKRRAAYAALAAGLLAVATWLFFRPYAQWYAQGYTKFHLWKGTHTPISAYLVHWGLFLFVIVSWMIWETRRWLAETPVDRALRWWLRQGRAWVPGLAGLTLLVAAALAWALHVAIAWLVVPLLMWALALLLRPGRALPRQIALLFVAAGLALTLLVEIVALQGDIGRMNTVFKFYFQVWTLFSMAAAFALGDLVAAACPQRPRLRRVWGAAFLLLVWGAALYPVLGGAAKMRDRMATQAPHTLDGMAYMAYAHYTDHDKTMDLAQDQAAIYWLQRHVRGTPIIVEANTVEYRWGSRITIYTGLPGVVGWNWHERQQRGVVNAQWVEKRVAAIGDFYNTTDMKQALAFLNRYGVRYIIVGQLERAYYTPEGLAKFPAHNGDAWREVFHVGDTTIYEVIQH